MIIIYTGNGKGKTSAATGQAIRALGQGKKVAFAQFFKRPDQAGEQKIMADLLQDNWLAAGPGFYLNNPAQLPTQRRVAKEVLAWLTAKAPQCFMLIADEALYALNSEIISQTDLQNLIDCCHEHGTHLVLSGRNLPVWLKEQADLVSQIEEVKHPLRQGQQALPGIEY